MNIFYDVPKDAAPSKCPRNCGSDVYWIEVPNMVNGKRTGTKRISIDVDVDGGSSPDSFSVGRGIAHLHVCGASS